MNTNIPSPFANSTPAEDETNTPEEQEPIIADDSDTPDEYEKLFAAQSRSEAERSSAPQGLPVYTPQPHELNPVGSAQYRAEEEITPTDSVNEEPAQTVAMPVASATPETDAPSAPQEAPAKTTTPEAVDDAKIDTKALIEYMATNKASDIYITFGRPASFRIDGKITTLNDIPINDDDIETIMNDLLDEEQIDDFESTLELNTAMAWSDEVRLRINVFQQMQHNALVIRRIETQIPTIDELNLPGPYKDMVMMSRGLVLVVGQTGSGKSTSLAAMINHRNTNGCGHIITVEDPVEYIHKHDKCIISQRDIGIDTYSFGMALKNALRQQPDVILIGEIRDRETMEHALNFSETGHLCLATLHANNANQAIERILSFFPDEQHSQILTNLSLNLRGIMSQRLLPSKKDGRELAYEVLINEGVIKALIKEGKVSEIKTAMDQASDIGMKTFDRSILSLFTSGEITEEVAILHSDNPANLRLAITQWRRGSQSSSSGTAQSATPANFGKNPNGEF